MGEDLSGDVDGQVSGQVGGQVDGQVAGQVDEEGTGPEQYRTIVVGTDGSSLAAPTVARAAWLAASADADLVIVCAFSDLTRRQEARSVASLGLDPRLAELPGRAAASSAIAAAVAVAQERGATISAALLIDAEPTSALLAAAAERGADLIVVGAVRDSGLADRLLGTVATAVVRRAECEVLVVRPGRGHEVTGAPGA